MRFLKEIFSNNIFQSLRDLSAIAVNSILRESWAMGNVTRNSLLSVPVISLVNKPSKNKGIPKIKTCVFKLATLTT